jgi:hypothetical protein
MDEQRELKKDLTSIQGAIETQDGIYIPLSEVERLLMNRITQVKNCSIPVVSQQRELLFDFVAHIAEQNEYVNEVNKNDIDSFLSNNCG